MRLWCKEDLSGYLKYFGSMFHSGNSQNHASRFPGFHGIPKGTTPVPRKVMLVITAMVTTVFLGGWFSGTESPQVHYLMQKQMSIRDSRVLKDLRGRMDPQYVEYNGTRADGFTVLKEFACENRDPGSCDGHVCTVTERDFMHVPWDRRPDSMNRRGQFSYSENTGLYTITMPRWNAEVDETRELGKLNRLLYDAPDSSLCSNPLCRLGPPSDGGWSVCIDEHHLQKRECLIYSIGISFKPLFAVASAALGCEIHMFDHTLSPEMQKVLSNLHSNMHFHPLGISAETDLEANMVSISDFMEAYDHDFIDVLKIDCEGCEWSVFEQFAKSHPGLLGRVGQLLIELHILEETGLKSMDLVTGFVDHVFGEHGFRIAYRHMNPRSAYVDARYRHLIGNQEALKDQPAVRDYPFWELVFLREGRDALAM